jgi:two-component system, response regulator FlrC
MTELEQITSLTFQNRTLIVADKPMRLTLAVAQRAAKSLAPVLLCGESGTGKELVARFIHEQSPRRHGPFISVNCAAIPDGLMEAELFGFERGAFTGAIAQRIGKFERANGGTLLLDEVSEMALPLQAKLLRVLQEGEIDRLGGRDTVPINSRIIATTNRDPLKLVRDEKFRQDLFYRLNVIRIDCVALRGRVGAILGLADHFIRHAVPRQIGRRVQLAESAAKILVNHAWPGNIRELQNAIERAILLCDDDLLEEKHFEGLSDFENQPRPEEPLSQTLAAIEQSHILQMLRASGGNRAHAARGLGISVRTLRNKLKEYGKS